MNLSIAKSEDHLLLLCCVVLALGSTTIQASDGIAIEVRETAGIRRFQYPVAVQLALTEPVPPDTHFRLLRDGQPALAQFCAGQSDQNTAQWWVDFPVNLLPYETQVYSVEYGGDVPDGPSRQRGMRLIRSDSTYQVVNEPYIAWTVPRDLKGLLSSVRSGDLEYLRQDSAGLSLRDRSGKDHPLGGNGSQRHVVTRVIREGLLAVGLRFETAETEPALEGVRSVVDLVFPVFKSWVEVDWRIDDPQGKLSSVGAEIAVNLDEPTRQAPTLFDFGATTLVYVSLRPGQEAQLRAGPLSAAGPQSAGPAQYAWQVFRGKPDRLEPFVFGPRRSSGHAQPEGWAHVMDRRRCLAIAVDDFALTNGDCISVSAEGTTQLRREFAARETDTHETRRMRFWMHFVPFPPQQTAATSPQSMQTPIVTRIVNDR